MINAHPDRAHSYLQTSPLHKASYPDVMPTAPTQVGGEGDVSEKAYTQLMRMAREAHAAGRYQTVEQAFAAVAVETENQKLLADSVLRSRARITSGYPG
jgi:hypothetical protein